MFQDLDKDLAREKKILETEKHFTHIEFAEKLRRAKREILNTNPDKVIKRWREEWDKTFWWIYGGKVYLIWWQTGMGKSTFLNQITKNVASQGIKAVKYSLEDRMEDIWKEELFYMINRIRYEERVPKRERCDFVNNEYKEASKYIDLAMEVRKDTQIVELDKKKEITIDDLCTMMDVACDDGVRFFAIDHLHYFQFDGSAERLDLQIKNAMHRINEIARKRNVAVFLIAHYKNNVWNWSPAPNWFRDAAAIKQVANIIIQIDREYDDNQSTFYITKLRWPIKPPEISTTFSLDTFEYDFKRTEAKTKEENEEMI